MGLARINAKEREKKEGQMRILKKRKGIKEQRVKPATPAWATDAPRGEKEQSLKQGVDPQPGSPGPFGCLLRPVWII